jgi:hypothetical protein
VLLFGLGVAWRLGGVVLVLCKCRVICSAFGLLGRGVGIEGVLEEGRISRFRMLDLRLGGPDVGK